MMIKHKIECLFNKIRWFWQKHTRGYSDCDLWNLDYHLAKHICKLLRAFKKRQHGYPACLSERQWQKVLDEMIAGFSLSDSEEKYFSGKYSKKGWEKMDKALKLLAKHYHGLWW